MRRSKVKIGMYVVLNDEPEGQVYRVESIDNYIVTVSYPVSGRIAVGTGDCSLLKEPSPLQMVNFARSLGV